MRWRSWRDSSGMDRSLTMVLSSTWPGVACIPWPPIRRFGVPFKEGENGELTGDDGNARDYSAEKPTLTQHNGTWGQARRARSPSKWAGWPSIAVGKPTYHSLLARSANAPGPASSRAALMEAVLPTRQVPKIATGSSGNRSFFRASGARFTLKAGRINANPRGDIMEGRFRVGWSRRWPFRKAFNYSSQLENLL